MLRNRKKTLQALKSLDAFPKPYEENIETSSSGGTLSLLSFAIMGFLIVWETSYYLETKFTFKFNPDIDFKEKLQINLDITVAMPCNLVGADVLDITGQHIITQNTLHMEDTWFELDPDQLVHFEGIQRVNTYLREEYHSIHHILWKNGYISIFGDVPERRRFPKRDKDACHISGSLILNKVSGNLHVTAGKSILLPHGHAHLAVFMDERDYNFSHRIEKLSFGDHIAGIIHPLEGDEEIAYSNMMSYQYFITVVPTKVNTYRQFGNTFQYSVSQQKRTIAHDQGSHGTPGIFFKYEFSALQVEVREEHEPFLGFFTRLLGIIAGVFTCSGLLHRLVGFLHNIVFCKYFFKKQDSTKDKVSSTSSLLDVSTKLDCPLIHGPPPISSPTLKSTENSNPDNGSTFVSETIGS